MARTMIGVNDPRAVKRWAGEMFTSTVPATFFGTKMMAAKEKDVNAPVHVRNDLKEQAGDTITYNIYAQLTGQPTFGDDTLEGNEASLDGYTDKITINAVKKPVDAGGTMTRKRSLDDLRGVAKNKLQDYMGRFFDESLFSTLAGSRGINPDYIRPVGVDRYIPEGEPFTPYDANHIIYGGSATSKAALAAGDIMTLDVLDKAITMAETEGGGQDGKMRLTPLQMDGENKYILLLHTWQEHALRTSAGANRWLDIQKAAAAAQGSSNPIFKSTLGDYRGCVIRKHAKAIRFGDYGAGSNVQVARAQLMGRQALVVAFGDAGDGTRATWSEKETDLDNSKLKVTAGMCYGVKRPQFNGQDINSIAIDTAVVKPY